MAAGTRAAQCAHRNLDVGTCYIVDGTLLRCWSWRAHPEVYSGKRKTTGMNVQVACMITGCLAWISGPIAGSRHDNHCLGESGVLLSAGPRNWLGDKGCIGSDMLNKQINKISYVIEQVIANFKTWRIMRTDSTLIQEPCNYQNPPKKQRFVFHLGPFLDGYSWWVIDSVACGGHCVNIANASMANGAAVQQHYCATVRHHSSWLIFVKPGTRLPCPCTDTISAAARLSGEA